MNAHKLLNHIVIGGALIMGGSSACYAAEVSVDTQSLVALAERVNTSLEVPATSHPVVPSSLTTEHSAESHAAQTPVTRAVTSHDSSAVEKPGTSQSSSSTDGSNHPSAQTENTTKPTLTPTDYIDALIAPLSVARDLGKNCQQVLSTNTGNQDICDQFDRAVDNLAKDQAKIEKTTPRPTDTNSVAPELMNQFKQLSQQLNEEVQYLRAYRATQN